MRGSSDKSQRTASRNHKVFLDRNQVQTSIFKVKKTWRAKDTFKTHFQWLF